MFIKTSRNYMFFILRHHYHLSFSADIPARVCVCGRSLTELIFVLAKIGVRGGAVG